MLWTEKADQDQAMTKISQGARCDALFRNAYCQVQLTGPAHRAQAGVISTAKFLAGNPPGYVEYQNKVRYRLIPLVW
jgi:hypothetical protein